MDSIFRYIVVRVGERPLAEDMTEEVFVRAWEALPGYRRTKHPFSSWLYRIAHNLVVDHHRGKSAREPSAELDPQALPDPSASPEDALAKRQTIAALADAVRQLSDQEQQVIVLRFVEGLPHRQVGKVIGKTAGASRMIQHRALAKLAELLHQRGESHGSE